MSTQLGNVVVAIKAVDEASAVMRNIMGAMDSIHGITSKLGGGFAAVGDVASAAFKGFAAGGPIGAAIATGTEVINQAVDALKWCVGEAAASEQAMKNLSIAVENSGIAWDSVKEGTTTALADLQKFTTYSDEQVAGALEKLLTFGLSYDDAMKALGSTVDLAAAKHMDLESAATIVGKAMDGNVGILSRYGVQVTTAKDASAALKAATETVTASLEANKGILDGFKDSIGDMGIKVNDSAGKMRDFKDIAKDIVAALAAGKIDTAEYGQTLADLGINVDTLKLSAADADDVLAALNTQFGGTAQEQAKTYAATQERLKNVMSDLGERIGGIFLPALTSMNEGMIGTVDSFNKGFDAIGAWLGEVGKIPEIKAATDAVSSAFGSLNQWFEDLGKTAMEILGPALDEIWGAFKEVWDALQPAREAFDEICTAIGDIFAAVSGGMGEGGFDAFKLILQAIVLPIRGIAEAIKLVIPVIKAFAEGFKVAADFIGPVLEGIAGAITGFINVIHDAFEGFYTWLVGGSLWMDMWNSLLSVASGMIGTLLGDLGTKLFEPMKNAFTGAMTWVEDSWNTGWQAVQTVFSTTADALETEFNVKFGALTQIVRDNSGQFAPITGSAMAAMGDGVNAALDILQGDWQGALGHIQDALTNWGDAAKGSMDAIMGGLQSAVKVGLDTIKGGWDTFTGALQSGVGTLQSALDSAGGSVQDTLDAVGSATAPATATVTDAFTNAFDTIATAATNFWNWLTGHSLWTDMLASMDQSTATTMSNIAITFQSFFSIIMDQATTWWDELLVLSDTSLLTLNTAFVTMLTGIQEFFTTIFASMVATAQSQMSAIISTVSSALAQVRGMAAEMAGLLASAQNIANQAAALRAQAAATVAPAAAAIASPWPRSPFTGALLQSWIDAMRQMNPNLVNIPYSYQTRPGEVKEVRETGWGLVDKGEIIGRPSSTTITVPVSVQVDGAIVAKTVEQRMITQRQLAGG